MNVWMCFFSPPQEIAGGVAGGWTVHGGVSLTEARPPGGTLSGRLLADGGAINEWPAERSDGGAALADEGGREASAGARSSGAQHPPRRAVPPSRSPRGRRHRARGAPRARGGEGGGVSWVCRSTERLCPSPLSYRTPSQRRAGKARSRRGGDAEAAHGGGGRGGGTGARLGARAVKSAVRQTGRRTHAGGRIVRRPLRLRRRGLLLRHVLRPHQGLLPRLRGGVLRLLRRFSAAPRRRLRGRLLPNTRPGT